MAGVVPPPFHGQGIATKALFDADLTPIRKHLVEIRSSERIDDVGKPSASKVFGLAGVIFSILRQRFQNSAKVFYYTAGSGAWVPFVRDLLILGICRPFFKRTVIHYHSGNVVDFLKGSSIAGKLGKWIYGRGAWAIRLGEGCQVPGTELGAERVFDVPNGVDVPANLQKRENTGTFRVIFLGNLFENKGVLDVISAVAVLARRSDRQISLNLVGAWPDAETQIRVEKVLVGLPDNVEVPPPAPAYGDEKWDALLNADVLVFPSRYERENVPLVIIEAMACGLPVVATRWRGIPSLVTDGETGYLVEPGDTESIADHLSSLRNDGELLERFGRNAAEDYAKRLTLYQHVQAMVRVLSEAAK
jgi:glycosyltransferase involved in cell wall biosynthesis